MKLKKSGLITKIILSILIVYAVTTLAGLGARIMEAREQQKILQAQIEELSAANEQLQYAIDHKNDDRVIAGIARDKLELVQRNEKVFFGK